MTEKSSIKTKKREQSDSNSRERRDGKSKINSINRSGKNVSFFSSNDKESIKNAKYTRKNTEDYKMSLFDAVELYKKALAKICLLTDTAKQQQKIVDIFINGGNNNIRAHRRGKKKI
jgi:hypothetical protein